MSNRFVELAKQAGLKAQSETDISPQEQLFAELIVKECVAFIGSRPYSELIWDKKKKLLEYFGIE